MSARFSNATFRKNCLQLLRMGRLITAAQDQSQLDLYHCGPCGCAVKNNLRADYQQEMIVKQDNVFPVMIDDSNDSSLSAMLRPYKDLLQLFPNLTPLGILCQDTKSLHVNNSQLLEETDSSNLFKRWKFDDMIYFYHFVTPSSSQKWLDTWQRQRLDWYKKFSNTPSLFKITDEGEKSDGASSFQRNGSQQELHVKFTSPWEPETIEAITSYDEAFMKDLESDTGIKLQVESGKKSFYPHVITISTSIDKALLAFLYDAFSEKVTVGDMRQVLILHPKLAPYMVAVVISHQSDDLRIVAEHLVKEFRQVGLKTLCYKHPTADCESQIKSYDEIGIPYTLLLDDKTLEVGVSQLRSRDTSISEPIHVTGVKEKLLQIYNAT